MIVVFAPTSLRMGLGRGHTRLLAGSALPLAASGLAMFALLNADQLIVGHIKGAVSLGCYALAVSLASWPIMLLAEPGCGRRPGSSPACGPARSCRAPLTCRPPRSSRASPCPPASC